VAFLDFVDASITNVALPHILTSLRFSVQSLQWVPSAYLLTYGGFMLLGGRLADLLGRRNVLLAGMVAVGCPRWSAGSRGIPACSSAPASRRDSGPPSCCLRRCPP
jgi:MFS family permease